MKSKRRPLSEDEERYLSAITTALCENHLTRDAAQFIADLHVRVARLERAIGDETEDQLTTLRKDEQ